MKAKYQLAVTVAERSAIVEILAACAATKVPAVSVAKLGGFPIYTPPAPRPAPKPTAPEPPPSAEPAAPSPVQGVHPGAFCSPQGALGYTSKGTLMRCSLKAGDIRARWRSA